MKDSTKNTKPVAPASTEPTMSTSAKPRVAAPEKGTLVKNKDARAADPTIKNKANRPNVKGTSGAAYGITAKMGASVAPEAGATQANGRIIPAAVNRSKPNFSAGMAE